MPNSWFNFKRFRIEQSGSAMKVGTDGVLIGAWVDTGILVADNSTDLCVEGAAERLTELSEISGKGAESGSVIQVAAHAPALDEGCKSAESGSVIQGQTMAQKRILDIGTGTGLIALMLAQRTEELDVVIDAIEIEPDSVQQARENIDISQWADRVRVLHTGLQEFAGLDMIACRRCGIHSTADSVALAVGGVLDSANSSLQSEVGYDLIVSNPPYFENSLASPGQSRTMARHTYSLTFEELVAGVERLLSADGVFAVIIPADSAVKMEHIAASHDLNLRRKTLVRSFHDTKPVRVMLEFGRVRAEPIVSELVIRERDNEYTDQYRNLTKEFYLKF